MPVARDQLLLYRGIAQGPLVHTLSEEPGHTPTPNDVEGSPIARSHRIGINRSMGRTRPPPQTVALVILERSVLAPYEDPPGDAPADTSNGACLAPVNGSDSSPSNTAETGSQGPRTYQTRRRNSLRAAAWDAPTPR